MEQILVFKTGAGENTDFKVLSRLLNVDCRIKRWNFDFDDCDNISGWYLQVFLKMKY